MSERSPEINGTTEPGFERPPMLCPQVGPGAFGHPGAGGSLAFQTPRPGSPLAT